MDPNLLVISASVFVAVFVLLTLLAAVMRLLMAVFPKVVEGTDPALIAAVTAAATFAFPGMKVTKVEEIK